MARQTAATRDGARATFLLEVALDRARLKQRLAQTLLEERIKRGGGDARRFPQPKMAEMLGYSLRQYQRLEDAADQSIPSWSDLERIADRLDLDSAVFLSPNQGDEDEPEEKGPDAPAVGYAQLLAEIRGLRRDLRPVLQLVEQLQEDRARATPGSSQGQ